MIFLHPMDKENAKKDFPVGTIIRIDRIRDHEFSTEADCIGEISSIDELGIIHCRMYNGCNFGLIPGEDLFHKVENNGGNNDVS